MQPQEPVDYNQPVAYDREGRPLYAHPPANLAPPIVTQPQAPPATQFVHVSRAANPVDPVMSPEMIRRHEDSKSRYPTLNLSKEEYVISEVRRHWIGLVGPLGLAILLALLILSGLLAYPLLFPSGNPPFESLLLPAVLLLILVGIGSYVVTWVYINNKFYLTNESVIQEIQIALFSHNEQTVSLSNIEDASYRQAGIMQTMLDYGSIRLSTEGDETTYRFKYVSNPKMQIAQLNNAVEAFKNGRPINND